MQNDELDIPVIVNEPNIVQDAQILDNDAHEEGIFKRNAIIYLLPNA